ncbi:MAG: hypothetical protein JSW27_02955, partial [Phycisphaerales bacterium]
MNLRNRILLLSILIGGCVSSETRIRVAEFAEEPVVEGSDIKLVGLRQCYGDVSSYTLSTGGHISETQLKLVREVASKFDAEKAEIAKLLLDLVIRKDDIEHVYFVSSYSKGLWIGSDIRLYIGLEDAGPYLRFTARYQGQYWLFANSFKVAADDYRWQSPQYTFKRSMASGIEEWVDIPATSDEIEWLQRLAKAENAIVRFQGSEHTEDVRLTPAQKDGIAKVLSLYKLMTRRPVAGPASTESSTDAAIVKAIESSDDFTRYRKAFITASRELVNEGRCSLETFEYNGGWVRSQRHR